MGGMLADHQIKLLGLVSPLQDNHLQPASVDLTLGCNSATLVYKSFPATIVYVGSTQPAYTYHRGWDSWRLPPKDFALFDTVEIITLPGNISGKFEGKSSLGRLGLMTHVTSGFIDPGFHGVLTLELYNCGPLTLVLRPGIRIGQVSFTVLDAWPDRIYGDPALGSHYQGARSVEGGKFDNAGGNHEYTGRGQ